MRSRKTKRLHMAKKTPTRAVRAGSEETRGKLIAAAVKEFNQHGYFGTDTNKIARRAGFAPQTFYRWFRDKTEIFLAVYRLWEEQEKEMLAKLIAARAPASDLVDVAVAHHRAYRTFRRSLRTLSYDEPEVRKARAQSRLRQIESIKTWMKPARQSTAEVATVLLQMERLADALAENEFDDLGVDGATAKAALAALQTSLRR
jgi:AcrR family transcriptional regulator